MLAEASEETDTDAGPRAKSAPERTCVVTRTVKPIEDLIRFVVDPQGAVVPDVRRRLPGRGVWVSADRSTLEKGIARNVFARAFKRQVTAPPALADETEHLLLRGVLDALSIAYKAGLVVSGFAKVEAALGRDTLAALLRAAEASADGVRKIEAAARRRFGEVPETVIFPNEQLDLALGRPNVIHAALLAGPASTTFLARHRALEVFRGRAPT
jgi:predicted RNA-binding protein YlxR (DUF448 family)